MPSLIMLMARCMLNVTLTIKPTHSWRYLKDMFLLIQQMNSSIMSWIIYQLIADIHSVRRWLKSTDKRIVIHFTPYHGSWLNLVEFWFGIINKKVLNESYGSAEELKESFDFFHEEWNSLLAHPFRWSYDGTDLHKKAVNRFIKMLKLAANKLEITSLTKQLRLMSNLFDNYFYEIPRDHWEELFSVLQSQETTIRHSIMNEEGPIKKKNVENALNSFLSVLEDYVLQNDKQEAAAYYTNLNCQKT